ncbi:YtxH domain-containing protein [Streptomyces zingiberis]|uniref:YtxH domain-containing protein n=1 Tax=Streptomyces zingiberis TaxID=2053010 RepID=A0ABX1BP44_9ACTN|nr:YtxH domain-containing protein [Streptomyces zingiberis]NJP99503.1 YtxH domain-containing protein [Streptomyces zingiberis]
MRYRLTFMTGVAVGYVLGSRAGRERYEQLRSLVRQAAQNPAVRNAAETAAQSGREAASKAAVTVDSRFGDRLPGPVSERVRSLRGRGSGAPAEDGWGT